MYIFYFLNQQLIKLVQEIHTKIVLIKYIWFHNND